MRKFKKPFVDERIELIYWEDASSTDEWTDRKNLTKEPVWCVSCGILVAESDSVVVLSSCVSSVNLSCTNINIPKSAIKSREVVWENLSK